MLQGRWGSGREQPLAAMKLALEKAQCPGPNCGFLRAGARLAVVILTDEDDCSGPNDPASVGNDARVPRRSPSARRVSTRSTTSSRSSTRWSGGDPIVAVIAQFDSAREPARLRSRQPGRLHAGPARGVRAAAGCREPRGRTLKASICQDFGATLLGIAGMIIPQTMPLQQAPADYRMMAVAVQKAGGATVPCQLETSGLGDPLGPDVVYAPAQGGALPTLTFQNDCRLSLGDRVDLRIVCAR